MSDERFAKCRSCAHEGPQLVVLQDGETHNHYAKLNCAECGKFIKWLPKPDSEKTKRPARHRNLVARHGKGFCEMCLRKESELPKGHGLEAQHVQEFQDNGSEERENIWIVCKSCHSLIHWLRTYHGSNHVQPIVEAVAEAMCR